ncbi:MAG: hypothetical protein ABH824_07605 [Nanoarchaeota archaeon]|nr:hypothetical protein [Nanoarchaeota archaeon]MBU1632397.1 hypothetical protein [Nanoarchaeota archaeon]
MEIKIIAKRNMFIIFSLIIVLFLLGCEQQMFVCPDGSEVYESSMCIEKTPVVKKQVGINNNEVKKENVVVEEVIIDMPKEQQSPKISENQEHMVEARGKEGIYPDELTIKVGDKVTWINKNVDGKDISITFQKDGSRKFINSDIILYNEEYSYIFEEAGIYDYWVLGYVPKAKIIVEES